MSSRREQLGALCGVGFVALLILGTFLVPVPPASNASPSTMRGFFVLHRAALLWSGVFWVLALPAFLGFLGALRGQFEGAEGEHVFFGSALVLVAMAAIPLTLMVAITQRLVNDGDQVMQGAYQSATFSGIPVTMAMAVFLVAGSTIMIRSVAGAHWVGWLGYASAICNGIAAIAIIVSDTTPLGVFRYLGLLGFAVWVLATAVLMFGHHVEVPMPTRRPAGIAPA